MPLTTNEKSQIADAITGMMVDGAPVEKVWVAINRAVWRSERRVLRKHPVHIISNKYKTCLECGLTI